MKNTIFGCLGAAAFVFILGSAGAFENDTIGFVQFAIQSLAGIAGVYLSLKNIDI